MSPNAASATNSASATKSSAGTALSRLLGDTLLSRAGEVKTAEALAGKSAVGLYFSAHWCPPCRGFTPKLSEAYQAMVAKGLSFEVVFVSSDRDAASFDEYFGEMPFLALPFADRDRKASLSKKYKISGIPSLVILDGATGDVITTDGRTSVSEDPKGDLFPWRPPTVWEALGSEFLRGKDGETAEIDELRGPGSVIGIYFSAHWCPPCKSFTPELVSTYNKVKVAGKKLEIVFASSDRDATSFAEYYSDMPWLALPHGDKRKAALSKMFEVDGIPTLVFIDGETGETITKNGRGSVGSDPDGAEFPWHPKPVTDLAAGADGLNEEVCLCAMMEECSDEVQSAAMAVMTAAAEAAKAAGEEIRFFAATKPKAGPVEQIRKLTKLGEPTAAPKMVLLDIADEGGFYTSDADELTNQTVEAFLAGYRAKTLERKQLG